LAARRGRALCRRGPARPCRTAHHRGRRQGRIGGRASKRGGSTAFKVNIGAICNRARWRVRGGPFNTVGRPRSTSAPRSLPVPFSSMASLIDVGRGRMVAAARSMTKQRPRVIPGENSPMRVPAILPDGRQSTEDWLFQILHQQTPRFNAILP